MLHQMNNKSDESIDDYCLIIDSTQLDDCIIIHEKNVNACRKRRSDSVISLSSSDINDDTKVDCIDLTDCGDEYKSQIKKAKQEIHDNQSKSQLNSPKTPPPSATTPCDTQQSQSPNSTEIKKLIDDLNIDDLVKFLGDEIDSVDTSNSSTTSTNSKNDSNQCKNNVKINDSSSDSNNSLLLRSLPQNSIEIIKKNLINSTIKTENDTNTKNTTINPPQNTQQQQQSQQDTPSNATNTTNNLINSASNSSISSIISSNSKPIRPTTLPVSSSSAQPSSDVSSLATQQQLKCNKENTLNQQQQYFNQMQAHFQKMKQQLQQQQQPTIIVQQPQPFLSSFTQHSQSQPQLKLQPIYLDAINSYKNPSISSVNYQPLFIATSTAHTTVNNSQSLHHPLFIPQPQTQPQTTTTQYQAYIQQTPKLPINSQQQQSSNLPSSKPPINNQQQLQQNIEFMNRELVKTNANNQIIHTYSRENPKIIVESGSIFNCNHDALVNRLSSDKNMSTSGLLAQQLLGYCGSNLQLDLYSQRTIMSNFNDTDKTYPIIITKSYAFKRFRCIFHVNLYQFDFTTDFSEIHFKKTVEKCLKTAIDNNLQTIAFPALGCGYLNYPASYVVKWFDECFSSFFLSYTCHNLQTIRIVLYEGDQYTINSFKTYYERKSVMPILPCLNNSDKPDDHYELTAVDELSEEFKIISTHFKSSLTNAVIKKIERVRNVHLEDMYEQSKKMLKKRNPENHLNEYKLFHGTSRDTIRNICSFGFNRSYCGKNGVLYGQGVYFARRASYSDRYSRMPNLSSLNSMTNEYSMILARVLVGVYQVGNSNIKDPGMRSDGNQYDSTVDKIQSPEIFVIYRDYRAYPSYLIHYS